MESQKEKRWMTGGGYSSCSDTKFEVKLAEQTIQHERLIEILKIYGYDVRLGPMPLILGYAGTIYTNKLPVLHDFGLNISTAKTVMKYFL